MTSNPSLLSLLAAGIYAVVAMACLIAAAIAQHRRQQAWHMRAWLLLAVFFIALAVLRWLGIEDALREDLRLLLRADDAYSERRNFQRPLAAIVVGLVGLGAMVWLYRGFRTVRGRRNVAVLAAGVGAFTMFGLVLLRLVSLSPVDALLYGPVKLNWALDIGSSVIVSCAAVYYIRLISGQPKG
jgi:cytochrome bd-type quinol oxidase subunit 2